jgi:hypothetical protein
MAEGEPAVEMPGQDLLAQQPADRRTDDAQPFTDVAQRPGFETKADRSSELRLQRASPRREESRQGQRLHVDFPSGLLDLSATLLDGRPGNG